MGIELPKAMSGHGAFIYLGEATIGRYGSPELVAVAMKDLQMQHAWVRIHGSKEMHAIEPERTLIRALKDAGIEVAGWGWCQGDDVAKRCMPLVTSHGRKKH